MMYRILLTLFSSSVINIQMLQSHGNLAFQIPIVCSCKCQYWQIETFIGKVCSIWMQVQCTMLLQKQNHPLDTLCQQRIHVKTLLENHFNFFILVAAPKPSYLIIPDHSLIITIDHFWQSIAMFATKTVSSIMPAWFCCKWIESTICKSHTVW